jgi:voltage-gated potassium channel
MTSRGTERDALNAARPPHRMIVCSVLRAAASTVTLVAVYYLLPLSHVSAAAAAVLLATGLAALTGLIVFQVRSIVRSSFPGLRAAEGIAVSVPLFLLLFAGTYVVMARLSASEFSEPLTHTDALYFTVTTFATVGFGDITPRAEAARLVVTGQMIGDLIIIGLGVRVITGAVSRGRQQRPAGAGAVHPGE